nr:ATP-binding cassette domain-containing protein [uncultured Cohaesibacter sp.]
MTHSDPLLAGTDISVRADGKTLLDSVSVSVSANEIVTIIGPNGGGKTTLLKALLGLLPIASGTVKRKKKLNLGYVPQKLVIDRTLPLTVKRLMQLTGRYSHDQIIAALGETGVAHKINDNIHSLSGGEMQRVLLARAIIRKPELMVLDEPVQGVDYLGEIALYQLIETIRNKYNCGILLVSHDLHMVMRASNRVICLNTHVCCSGQPTVVEQSPDYQRLFGTRGLQTMAPYGHRHGHFHDVDQEESAPLAATAGGEPHSCTADHHHHEDHEGHHHAR